MKIIKSASAVLAGLLAASTATASAFALNLETRDGHTSAGCFTFEVNNKAWAHLINPYNDASLYNPPTAKEIADDTKDLIIQFTVTGVQEEFTVFPGFQVHGDDDDNGEELSIWSQDDYNSAIDSEYTYKIDRDGSYELVVPFKALADGLIDKGFIDAWGSNLGSVGILELCFSGVGNDDMSGFKHEDFSIEFTGIVESTVSRTIEECAFNGGEPVKFYDESQSPAQPTDEPENTTVPSDQSDNTTEAAGTEAAASTDESESTVSTDSQAPSSSSSDFNPMIIIIIACVCIVAVIAAVIIIIKNKKK